MVRLNHTTVVDNKPITPFLVQGSQVYCFDKYKKTIILPLNSFKARKEKLAPRVPMPIITPVVAQKPKPPVEEVIIIKPKLIHTEIAGGSIRTMGSADYKYKTVKAIVPKVITTDINKPVVFNYKPNGFVEVLGSADTSLKVFKPYVKKYEGIGIVQAVGSADSKVKTVDTTPPPVVDNSRYVGRPTLNDDYI